MGDAVLAVRLVVADVVQRRANLGDDGGGRWRCGGGAIDGVFMCGIISSEREEGEREIR